MFMKTHVLFLVSLLVLSGLFGAIPVILDSIPIRFEPALITLIKADDYMSYRLQLNSDFQKKHDTRLGAYNNLIKPNGGAGDYSGEYYGKWLDAACGAWKYSKDALLLRKIDSTITIFSAKQKADGYMGNYVDSCRWTWWDHWNHKYSMLGLLHHYEITDSLRDIEICKKAADLMCHIFLDSLGPVAINSAGDYPAHIRHPILPNLKELLPDIYN